MTKIRNHRKYEWWFRPSESSKLEKHLYRFKYKADMMKFLNKNFVESLNGIVELNHSCFNSSGVKRRWFVWYNDYKYGKLKIELRQENFRGNKYIFKEEPLAKSDKKYFAFSKKTISLMCRIKDEMTSKNAQKLITLFYKRGFKDFKPSEEDWEYIEGHIKDGIDFYHWSDRCNYLRCKVILEYFKRENLLTCIG